MRAIETEIKFRVEDNSALEQRLINAGFRNITPRTFERNVLYDTPDRKLRADRQILRIRQYGPRWVVTHKRMPPNDASNGRHKQRIETETEVADGETMASVFESLGFTRAFVYEKWRAEWADGTGHCVVDETPIGTFAELEGPSEWIDIAAAKLGVDAAQFLTLSYGRMFETWKSETASPAENMTFEEVCGSSVSQAR